MLLKPLRTSTIALCLLTSLISSAGAQSTASLVDEIKKKQEAITKSLGTKTAESEAALGSQKRELSERQKELAQIEQQIASYEQELEHIHDEISTLTTQLAGIENAMVLTQLKIRSVLLQIAEKEQDIVANTQNVDMAQVAVENQKDILRTFISLLFKQDVLYFARDKALSGDPSLYLGSTDLTTVLARKRYLETLQQAGTHMLEDFKDIGTLLSVQRTQLANDQKKLVSLKEQLAYEERNLDEQKKAKSYLLTQTQGKEENYQSLLQQSKSEQEEAYREVEEMQKNIQEIETKIRAFQMTSLGSSALSAAEIEQRKKILESLGTTAEGKLGLSWPVEPKRGISAYFQDPSYQSVFGVAHSAIDIPAPQGTEIKAPADGYVTKVKDAGMGYSYIIIAHTSGVMTLYGHVSEIWVKAGDYVSRGQSIGKSGGAPGTKGAGWMTTGAHLHFEVFQDGKHVNPTGYLDMSLLPKK